MFLLVTDSLNFEGLKMHKWNVPTDKVQIVDEKNEGTQEDLSVALKCFAQAATNFFAVVGRKYEKEPCFTFSKTITLEENLIFTIFKTFYFIFITYSLNSLCWFISSLYSKNFKIPFQ